MEDGVTVTLGHFVTEEEAIDSQTFGPTEHWMTSIDPNTGQPRGALDAMSFSLHDGQLAHMDALCHYATRRNGESIIFNGYPQNLTVGGCTGDLGIDDMGPGYVTRGILVDMPLLRGVDWLDPSTPIYVSDLEEWEAFAGITVSSGDVLFIRAGRWARREAEGPWNYARGGAGLHASVLPWLKERGVSLLVGDAVNDVSAVRRAGHQPSRPHHGRRSSLGCRWWTTAIWKTWPARLRTASGGSFMVSWQITNVPNGTASPFNAIATF